MAPTLRVLQASWWLLIASLLVGWSGQKKSATGTEADTDFASNKAVFASIHAAGRLILYEGLPHHAFEAKELKLEKRKKRTMALHGCSFYRDHLKLSAYDQQRLKSLLGSEASFAKWSGEKRCGGFHPDYCVQMSVGRAAYRFLICFGCHEVKVYGPKHSLRCDIQRDAYVLLEKLLKKHRKNRPPKESR